MFTSTPGNAGPLSAAELVTQAANLYEERTERWIGEITQTLHALDAALQIQPVNFTVTYNPEGFLPRFERPERPTLPAFPQVTVAERDVPDLEPVALRELGEAPAEPDLSPYLDTAPPTPPNAPMPTAPADIDVVLDPITMPDRPAFVLPTKAELYALDLPEVPELVLPEFDGQRPQFALEAPEDGRLAYVETAYRSDLLDAMKAKLGELMQGQLGLPLVVEQAMFDRGRAREDRASRKLLQEVDEAMASRGLTVPNGLHARALREAHTANRDATHGLNRDVTIRTAEMAVEGLRFALTQGMVLEQTLIQQNEALNERALRVALAARDYAIQRFNALVGYHNLQWQAYQTDAQVYRTRIDAKLSELEILRAKIEQQRLVGEVNKTLVEQFEAEYRGLQALADFYRTDVEAAKARGEINVQRIQAAELLVRRFATQMDAWGKQHDAYGKEVEAWLGRTRIAEVLAGVFATRMRAYQTKGEAYFNEGRFKIERNQQVLEAFRAALASDDQRLRAQLGNVDAIARRAAAEAVLYQADAGVAQAESAAYDRTAQLKIENERNRVQAALQQAELSMQQMLKIADLLSQILRDKANVLGQLVASSQSGVNYGASLSGSLGTSFGYGKSFSYSGDTADATPNF